MRDFGAYEPFWPSRCHAGRLAIQSYFFDETIRNTASISTLPRLRWGWEYMGDVIPPSGGHTNLEAVRSLEAGCTHRPSKRRGANEIIVRANPQK